MIRDCPSCEQGKHVICNEEVLDDVPLSLGNLRTILNNDDNWIPCPCAVRGHEKAASPEVSARESRPPQTD